MAQLDVEQAVYVVVLNWNRADDTLACAASVLGLQGVSVRLVICDNASRSSDVDRLRDGLRLLASSLIEWIDDQQSERAGSGRHMPVALIHTGANLGYAGGMNAGIHYAMRQPDMSHVWILNNDTEVHPDCLRNMLLRMRVDPMVGICGATLVYHGRRNTVQAHGGASYIPWRARSMAIGAFTETSAVPAEPSAAEAKMAYVIGASMLVPRRALIAVGPMDPSYFLYSEEHDWATRMRANGFRLAWAPKAIVYHKHGATIGTSASGGSTLSLFYLYRSKALYTFRHHRMLLPLALTFLAWEGTKLLLKGHPSKAWAVWRGLAAFPAAARAG